MPDSHLFRMAGYAVSKRCTVADWFSDDTESGKRKFLSVIGKNVGSPAAVPPFTRKTT